MRFPPFARHVAANIGLTYPAITDLDHQYLQEKLETPLGTMHYDQIFDRAMENVLDAWAHVADAVFRNSNTYQMGAANWNLDTGRDPMGRYVYWQEKGLA